MINQLIIKFKNLRADFLARFKFLKSHPEFSSKPYIVITRLIKWEIFKIIRYNPTIKIHKFSKMRLRPGKRIGINGFIYIFRDKWEPAVCYVIERYALPGETCYDIGANIGLWTLKMAEAVGTKGYVYAFEPVSKNIDMALAQS